MTEPDYQASVDAARERAKSMTPVEHLWAIALAVGPDRVPGRGMWETADGTPVDISAHIVALAEHLRQSRRWMSLQAAVAVARDTDSWCRPVSWRGTGQAICVRGERLTRVPSKRGGSSYLGLGTDGMLGPWEVVAADVVNSEVPRG
jgi:hypothetical protein